VWRSGTVVGRVNRSSLPRNQDSNDRSGEQYIKTSSLTNGTDSTSEHKSAESGREEHRRDANGGQRSGTDDAKR
jgi:hypothetical protein